MADNNVAAPEAKEAQDVVFSEEMLARIVSDATSKILEQEAGAKRTAPKANPDATGDAKPEVKGERVPHWQIRGLKSIQAVAGLSHTDTGTRGWAAETYQQMGRYHFAMAPSQREEEDKIARQIVQAALDDKFITAKGAQRVYNLLDDPKEREFLSETRVHSTLTGPSGEFIVPKPMLATIYTIIEEYGLAQRLCQIISLASKDLELNSIATAPTATWTGETELFTASDLALGQNILTTSKLGAVSSISMEQEEDQLTPLIPVWLRKIGENIALAIDQSVFIGDGTSTYGGFVGITNMSGAQVNTLASGELAPSDLAEGDFRNTKQLLTTTRRQRAQWVMARIVWDYVEQFESTLGARIVQEVLTGDARMRFLGFPVLLSEALDNTDGDVASRDMAILGDFSNTLLGFRRGITVETSKDGVLSNSSGVVTLNAFQQDAMLVKISLRVGHQTPTGVQDAYAILNSPSS